MENEFKHIFYLQLTNKLPNDYYDLSLKLSKQGIVLIPVTSENLVDFIHGNEKMHLIAVINNSKSKFLFQKKVERFIFHLISNRKIFFYLCNSFSSIFLREPFINGKKAYVKFDLPVELNLVCDTISSYYNYRWLKENEKQALR